jgi:uncharacterized membrane protein
MSTVKFVFGAVPTAVGMGFSLFETVTVTSLGGFTGVICFVFLSETIVRNYKKRIHLKHLKDPNFKPPKIFTKRKRRIVTVKKRFGILGIAFLTPLLFSIPIGCFIAVRYFKNKQQILLYMFGSIFFWSVTTYYLSKFVFNAVRTYFF